MESVTLKVLHSHLQFPFSPSRTKLRSSKGQYFHQGTAVDLGRKKPLQVSEARQMALHSTINWIEGQVAAWKHFTQADTGRREDEGTGKSRGPQGEVGRSKPAPHVYLSGLSPRHFMGGEWNMGGGCQDMTVSLSLLSYELRCSSLFIRTSCMHHVVWVGTIECRAHT